MFFFLSIFLTSTLSLSEHVCFSDQTISLALSLSLSLCLSLSLSVSLSLSLVVFCLAIICYHHCRNMSSKFHPMSLFVRVVGPNLPGTI